MRKLLSLLLACSMLLSCLTLPAAADGSLANFTRQSTYREGQYSDVNASDWYAENIKAGTELGIVKGYGDRFGVGDLESIAEAIKYAEASGAVICNMSLSGAVKNKSIYDAMKQSKMLFVTSAGNNGRDNDSRHVYPACYDIDNMIVVANATCDGTLFRHSNYGKKSVDIAAPGSYILSTTPENGYGYLTGTSMSAPVVSAAAAMLYSNYSNITLKRVKDILLATARANDALEGKCATGGILDLGAAMEYAARLKNLKA